MHGGFQRAQLSWKCRTASHGVMNFKDKHVPLYVKVKKDEKESNSYRKTSVLLDHCTDSILISD